MDNSNRKLTPNDYKKALDAQSACNLSGLAHSFSKVVSVLWNEANELGEGTEWVNTHPISVLYTYQMGHLSGVANGDLGQYSYAYNKAMEMSQ